ncbi:MAG: DUF6427 family protein [Flavobacteriaceae bacterium]
MISSIFGKTKPINYIILLTFLFFFYWFVHVVVFNKGYSVQELGLQLLVFAVLSGSMFLVDHIVLKNKLTDANSFAILFFTILMVVFPEALLDNNAIFCGLFLLLAMRRLITVRSLKDIKLKIFDATFWVVVASLFYDWALLYLIIIFAAIYIYEPKNIRNWAVPFAGVFAVFMVTYGVLILSGHTNFLAEHYTFAINFDVLYFANVTNSSKLVLYVLAILALTIFAFLKLGKAGLGKIVTMRLIALFFIVGLVVKVLSKADTAYPISITFFPAVVFLSNYVESIKKEKLQEILLIACIIVPLLVLLMGTMVG